MTPGFVLDPDTAPGVALELLYSLKVRDVMTTKLICGKRSTTLRQLRDTMRDNDITGVPIMERDRIVGMVSMEDILRAMEEGRLDCTAEECMTRSVISLADDMPVNFAISYLEKHGFGRFPVLNRDGDLVGILTSRDILTHLLVALNRELERIEAKDREARAGSTAATANQSTAAPAGANAATGAAPEGATPGTITQSTERTRIFTTRKFDFERAGRASTEIKRILTERGVDPRTARRVAVASYELEMNQVVHSVGGTLRFSLLDDGVEILAVDRGPGIPDIEAALTEGWSTATEWIRSLGFGAGMGLTNTRRVSDEFEISSNPDGTSVRVRINLG